MGKTYDRAPDSVRDRCVALMKQYHPDLVAVTLRIDVLMASTDTEDGHAVTHGGYPALAVVRIISSKDRAKDQGDAEIVIDRDAYEAMTDEQRDALLDHELYHLEIVRDKVGQPKRDDHQRPKLKMRKHDYQMGWFAEIARRHGKNSCEVRQATELFEESGQLFFGFSLDGGKGIDVAIRSGSVDENAAKSAARRFVNNLRSAGATVEIRTGDVSVTVDPAANADPKTEELDEAARIANAEGFLTRSKLQRALRIGYNHACAIVDRLVALHVVAPATDTDGRFNLVTNAATNAA